MIVVCVCVCTVCTHSQFASRLSSSSCDSISMLYTCLPATQVRNERTNAYVTSFSRARHVKLTFAHEKIVPTYCNSHHAKWAKPSQPNVPETLLSWQQLGPWLHEKRKKVKREREKQMANITNTHEWAEMHEVCACAPMARQWVSDRASEWKGQIKTRKKMKTM